MVANQKIIAAINEQMGNEFSAMLQYYAIAAHFGAEGLRGLSAHFYKQAEEEARKGHYRITFSVSTSNKETFSRSSWTVTCSPKWNKCSP